MNSDCTGSFSDSSGPVFNSVVVSGGKEAFLINTTPGATFEIDGKKQ